MSLYSVLLSNTAKKQLPQLEPKMRGRVTQLFKRLEEVSVPYKDYDMRKIEGRDETYRVRLSSFRVLYRVLHAEKTVWIEKIERRSGNTYY